GAAELAADRVGPRSGRRQLSGPSPTRSPTDRSILWPAGRLRSGTVRLAAPPAPDAHEPRSPYPLPRATDPPAVHGVPRAPRRRRPDPALRRLRLAARGALRPPPGRRARHARRARAPTRHPLALPRAPAPARSSGRGHPGRG